MFLVLLVRPRGLLGERIEEVRMRNLFTNRKIPAAAARGVLAVIVAAVRPCNCSTSRSTPASWWWRWRIRRAGSLHMSVACTGLVYGHGTWFDIAPARN